MSTNLVFYCDNKRHLVCKPYSIENLHKMAKKLGIRSHWFHKNHYDIPKRRIDEIKSKCIIVTDRDIVRIKNNETIKMNNLEFKYITRYLPYDLELKWDESGEIMGITFYEECDFTNRLYPLSTLLFILNEKPQKIGFKLLLKPLSYLTKAELIDNGIKTDYLVGMQVNPNIFPIENAPYNMVEYLISKKYDVFNLIGNDFAVNSDEPKKIVQQEVMICEAYWSDGITPGQCKYCGKHYNSHPVTEFK